MRKAVVAAFLLAMSAAGCGGATEGAARETMSSRMVPLTITSGKSVHKFRVEVARTETQQARGLMFRSHLAPDAGMIFPMSPPRFASFWMKNTIIPLDLIFVRADGRIARIAANAVPYSLAPIPSDEPVGAVLEIAGGRAAQLGIGVGDTVTYSAR